MLTTNAHLGEGILSVKFPKIWKDAQARLTRTFNFFYQEPVPAGFFPHFNELTLRSAVLSAVPELVEIQEQIQELWDSGVHVLILDELGLKSLPERTRNINLYALALTAGYPTPSGPHRTTLLWDVKPRPVPAFRDPTYSEHKNEAFFHTDSQYFPNPETYQFLYAIHAANCGGGTSLFCTASSLRESLLKTSEGRDAYEVLSNYDFPFRYYDPYYAPFMVPEYPNRQNVILAPIFSSKPEIRFRKDVIEQGFAALPELDTPDARKSLGVFVNTLKHSTT